jgi:transaldolase
MNQLQSIAQHSIIVADTGDIEAIARLKPRDATTNPSLILQAAQDARYKPLIAQAQAQATDLDDAMDRVFVAFGREILKHVPGRVSTEVDAALSFDTQATLAKARRLISLYETQGTSRERVLIKIAATWEGIKAAEQLEREGIHCNLTLLFGFAQAVACAQAGVQLISPFVGRIYDWHKTARKVEDIAPSDDPGVASVARIFHYYKKHGYKTEVMGASFRKTEQIALLSGCDLLTISPDLLDKLAAINTPAPRALDASQSAELGQSKIDLNEAAFRMSTNEDAMATEKLADGIRKFNADARKLEAVLRQV